MVAQGRGRNHSPKEACASGCGMTSLVQARGATQREAEMAHRMPRGISRREKRRAFGDSRRTDFSGGHGTAESCADAKGIQGLEAARLRQLSSLLAEKA